jgi:hypothetical protein
MSNQKRSADPLALRNSREELQMQLSSRYRAIRTVNAVVLLIIAVLLSNFIFFGVTALFADYYGVIKSFHYDGISFIDAYSRDWHRRNVFVTFSAGYLACAFLALFFYLLLLNFRKRSGTMKVLYFYFTFSFLLIIISQIVLIPFSPLRGLGVITEWLYWSEYVQMIVAVACLIALPILSGFILAKPFLQTSVSYQLIKSKKHKRLFIRDRMLIPYMITAVFFFVFYQRIDTVNRMIIILTGLVMAFTLQYFARRVVDVKVAKSTPQKRINPFYLVLLLLLIAFLLAFYR